MNGQGTARPDVRHARLAKHGHAAPLLSHRPTLFSTLSIRTTIARPMHTRLHVVTGRVWAGLGWAAADPMAPTPPVFLALRESLVLRCLSHTYKLEPHNIQTRLHPFCYLRFQLRRFAGLANMVQPWCAAPSAYSLPATTSPANNGQRKDSRLTFRCVNSTQLSQTCRRDSTTN